MEIELQVVPNKEPSYLIAARMLARSRALEHEIPEIMAVASLLRPGTTFVDCGANVGLWTTSLARLGPLLPGLKVLSFEANPDTFLRLASSSSHYPNVRCFNMAVSDHEGEIEMMEGGSSLVFGIAGGWNAGGKLHRLKAVPLDNYLDGIGDICLKIDVEGHEWPVLLGAKKAIEQRRVRAILIDGHPAQNEAEIVNFLKANNFRILEATSLAAFTGGTMSVLALRE